MSDAGFLEKWGQGDGDGEAYAEKLEKFARQVARVPLMDIDTICGNDDNRWIVTVVIGPQLKKLIREAKKLTGVTRKSAGAREAEETNSSP